MIILFLLLLPFTCFAQEWVIGEGNQFNFAVGLQYDIETDVIGDGVITALTNWTGDSYEITEGLLEVEPYSYWTNYPTNGLPSEVVQNVVSSLVSTLPSREFDRFGVDGLPLNPIEDQGLTTVYLPVLTGSGTTSNVINVVTTPTGNGSLSLANVKGFLGVTRVPQGFLRDVYDSAATGVYELFTFFASFKTSIRNFVSLACTSIATINMIFFIAVITSGLFRSVVAGVTGISGGK